jgi:hypothetical protein
MLFSTSSKAAILPAKGKIVVPPENDAEAQQDGLRKN